MQIVKLTLAIFVLSLTMSGGALSAPETTDIVVEVAALQKAMELLNHQANLNMVPLIQIQTGVQMFQRTFERWPRSWAEIKSSGIWQTPLRTPGGQLVDPDDYRIDFEGDVYYDTSETYPRIVMREHTPHQESLVYKTDPGGYRELFAKIDTSIPDANTTAWLNDSQRMTQFGIIGAMNRMLSTYKDHHGDYPQTIDDFINSGLSPVDRTSINPVTGQPFKFDGSANDIHWKYIAPKLVAGHDKPIGGFRLSHVLPDGSQPRTNFSY